MLQAVVSKYGVVEGVTAGVNEKDIKELQAEIGARFVEVVGFDKVNKQQSQVKSLQMSKLLLEHKYIINYHPMSHFLQLGKGTMWYNYKETPSSKLDLK